MRPQIPSPIEYVHLQWDGPKSWEEKTKLRSAEDYGIYQIYHAIRFTEPIACSISARRVTSHLQCG